MIYQLLDDATKLVRWSIRYVIRCQQWIKCLSIQNAKHSSLFSLQIVKWVNLKCAHGCWCEKREAPYAANSLLSPTLSMLPSIWSWPTAFTNECPELRPDLPSLGQGIPKHTADNCDNLAQAFLNCQEGKIYFFLINWVHFSSRNLSRRLTAGLFVFAGLTKIDF